MGSAMVEMQRGDKASLLLRVRSIDPRRPCVKDHNSITLRAENVHAKYEWIARLQRAAAGAQPSGADPSLATVSAVSDASDSTAGGGIPIAPVAGPPPPGSLPPQDGADALELARRNSLDHMATTRLGQGAKFFRADDLRDDHGRLLPAPGVVLLPGQGPPAGVCVRVCVVRGGRGVVLESCFF